LKNGKPLDGKPVFSLRLRSPAAFRPSASGDESAAYLVYSFDFFKKIRETMGQPVKGHTASSAVFLNFLF
jgi:hypothetical protein